MDKSAVEKIVREAAPGLSKTFGLSFWAIRFAFDVLPGSDKSTTCGAVDALVSYNVATIRINPEAMNDEAEVLGTLRHELFHIAISPMNLFSEAIAALGLNEQGANVLDRVWTHAIEQTVLGLERMYANLTAPAVEPTKKGKTK
jgi:hypothetical protein